MVDKHFSASGFEHGNNFRSSLVLKISLAGLLCSPTNNPPDIIVKCLAVHRRFRGLAHS